MPIINYKDLKKYLAKLGNHPVAPVYLIYGEEMLTKNAFDELLDALIPVSQRNVNYEPLDGAQETIHEVIGRVNTYSLLPGIKVVALRDSKIFDAGQDKERLLDNAKKPMIMMVISKRMTVALCSWQLKKAFPQTITW